MQTENRFFDDFAKVLNGAAGTFAGMTREAEANFRDRMRNWIGGLDLVTREEFDAVKAMAAKARSENDALRARLDALEGKAATPKATDDNAKSPAKSKGGSARSAKATD